MSETAESHVGAFGDAADHVSDARRRARAALSGEAHLGDVDDWRQGLVTARDGVLIIWLVWVAFAGFGYASHSDWVLVSIAAGVSLYLGLATAVATRVRLRYYERELDRERSEIRDQPEHEREEVRALYAAKGFREPLLTQITDVLCADDDRLLKVMMEEELGLFIQHMNHPLLVGTWNTIGALIGTMPVAIVAGAMPDASATIWVPATALGLLVATSIRNARATQRSAVEIASVWIGLGVVAGGVTYFVAGLLSGGA
jgi:vacuolar iron transporter family protein